MLFYSKLDVSFEVNIGTAIRAKKEARLDDLNNNIEFLIISVHLSNPGVGSREVLSIDLDSVRSELLLHIFSAEDILQEILAFQHIHVAVGHAITHDKLGVQIICILEIVVVRVVGKETVIVFSSKIRKELKIQHVVVNHRVSD
jgi:hypothetical protein